MIWPLRPEACCVAPPASLGLAEGSPAFLADTAVASCAGVASDPSASSGCRTKATSSWQRLAGVPLVCSLAGRDGVDGCGSACANAAAGSRMAAAITALVRVRATSIPLQQCRANQRVNVQFPSASPIPFTPGAERWDRSLWKGLAVAESALRPVAVIVHPTRLASAVRSIDATGPRLASATSLPRGWRRTIMPRPRSKPWPPDPNQTASEKPGAVQLPLPSDAGDICRAEESGAAQPVVVPEQRRQTATSS